MALWKGKEGSKARASGSIELGGRKLKLWIFTNDNRSGQQPHLRIAADEDELASFNGTPGHAPTEDDGQADTEPDPFF